MKKPLLLAACICLSLTMQAQDKPKEKQIDYVHGTSKTYEWPTDTAVINKLKHWQDQKFGVLFHWGIYAVQGISESWTICSEDRPFISNGRKRTKDLPYDKYKEWYWDFANQFNPVNFEPADWAKLMKDAGFKYVLFTTKHHDGFCMFDSKYTDFSVAKGPYRNGKYSNVAKHLFDAFRNENFMIGAYFSKADWHCTDYWDPFWATPTRNQNYDIKLHPDKWAKFQQFTANQIDELMTDYGRMDVLWLDAGWVRAPQQDIRIDEIVEKARQKQPGLIVADRTVAGRNENYLTPERKVPETQLNYPWESCLPLSGKWGWKPNAEYQPASWVINTLAEIVAKGGCFALGIGPSGDGTFDQGIHDCLRKVGAWLKQNGKAIYATRTTPHYNSGRTWFTADKNGKTLYAIYTLPEGETLPATIEWEGNEPKGKITLLQNGKRVKYTCQNGKVIITLPEGLKNETLAFSFQAKNTINKN